MANDDTVDLPDVELVHESPAATCVRVAGRELWVPKSGIVSSTGLRTPGDRGTLRLFRWAAETLGLA